jgi:hypothetical protein
MDILTHFRKIKATLDSGVPPDKYRFIVHPGEGQAVWETLIELGVSVNDLDLYKINEMEEVEPGQVIVMDLETIEAKFQEILASWRVNFKERT